ncbi:MAG: DUF3726 domain-containing protein [Yoonia sp.]|nr:DUF3726 domain-containing protein [Yoonia sp.]
MTYSLNEIEALCKRAARGVGLSWGIAEDAAKAVRWLASFDLPSVAPFAQVLALHDDMRDADFAPMSLTGPWSASAGRLCPLLSGAALSDCAQLREGETALVLSHVVYPVLLLPFAAQVATRLQQVVMLSWDDLAVMSDGQQIWLMDSKDQCGAEIAETVTFSHAERPASSGRKPQVRGSASAAVWAQLNDFAHRTYAPATEQSRLLGAGAGNSDND